MYIKALILESDKSRQGPSGSARLRVLACILTGLLSCTKKEHRLQSRCSCFAEFAIGSSVRGPRVAAEVVAPRRVDLVAVLEHLHVPVHEQEVGGSVVEVAESQATVGRRPRR